MITKNNSYTLRLTDLQGYSTVFEFNSDTLALARAHAESLVRSERDLRTLAKGLAYGRGVLAEFRRNGTVRWRSLGVVRADTGAGRTLRSLDEIKEANRAGGFHFFSPDTMRFFRSFIREDWVTPIDGGALFISSESGPDGRRYSLNRCLSVDGRVETIGKFQQFGSAGEAKAALRAEAARLHEEAAGPFLSSRVDRAARRP
mgnify:CR=1 FL=1